MEWTNQGAPVRVSSKLPVGLRRTMLVCSLAIAGVGHAQVPAPEYQPPPFLLAETYADQIDLHSYWVSEKLDGVRAWWTGKELISRGGHVYNAPAWFTEDFPELPLDGELWMGRGTFEKLSAAVRRHEPSDAEWRAVRFVMLDLPGTSETFERRLEIMELLAAETDSTHLVTLEHMRIASREALLRHLDAVVAAGGEGLMLRHSHTRYHAGRSNSLLKLKRWQDAEAVVIAHMPGRGRLEGVMGSLLVETGDGQRFRLGTGFTDAERHNPPPLGATVTFRHQGWTEDGIPRFAAFQRIYQTF